MGDQHLRNAYKWSAQHRELHMVAVIGPEQEPDLTGERALCNTRVRKQIVPVREAVDIIANGHGCRPCREKCDELVESVS